MPSTTRNIDIIFGGIDKNTKRTIFDIENSLSVLNTSVRGVTEPLGSFTEDLLKSEAAVAALGTAMIGLAAKEAGDFNAKIEESGALFNGTDEQIQTLHNNLIDFARDAVFSFDDIQAAQFKALSTGTNYANVTDRLTEAQKLAVASSSGLESSTALLSQSLNIYGDSAGTAKEVSEALFVAAQQGDTNFSLLSSSLGQLLQPAQAASVEFEEMLAAVSAVTIGTGQTAESMTLLKALFKELASPSDQLADALGGMNLETDSLQAIMQKLQQETNGQFAAMDKLFSSTEAVNAALILSSDTSGKFADALEAMANKTGTVDAAFERMSDNTNLLTQKLVNNIRATLVDVGTPLLDEFGDGINALSSVFESLGTSIKTGGLQVVEQALEEFVGNGVALLEGMAEALPDALDRLDFSGVLDSFNNLQSSFETVFQSILGEELDLTNADDLAQVLQKLIDFLELTTNASAGAVQGLKPLADAVTLFLETLANSDTDTQIFTGEIGGLSISLNKLLPLFELLGDGLSIVAGAFVVVTTASSAAKAGLGGITSALTAVSPTGVALAAAIGSVTFALRENTQAYADYQNRQREFDATQQHSAETQAKIAERLKGISDSTGLAINSIEDLNRAQEDGIIVFNEATGQWEKAGKAVRDFDAEVEQAANESINFADSFGPVNELLERMGQGSEKAAAKTKGLGLVMFEGKEVTESYRDAVIDLRESGLNGVIKTLQDGTSEFVPYTKKMDEVTQVTNELTEAQRLAADHAHELQLALLDIANDQQLAAIEFSAQIDIAQIEADAATTIAAFESIASSVDSTNDLIAELFSHDAPDWDKFGFDTREALDRAQDRAERLTDSQIELNDAQIRILEARADALERGDAAITINADQLEPELQLVLKSLIENVQIQANQEGLELLT